MAESRQPWTACSKATSWLNRSFSVFWIVPIRRPTLVAIEERQVVSDEGFPDVIIPLTQESTPNTVEVRLLVIWGKYPATTATMPLVWFNTLAAQACTALVTVNKPYVCCKYTALHNVQVRFAVNTIILTVLQRRIYVRHGRVDAALISSRVQDGTQNVCEVWLQ